MASPKRKNPPKKSEQVPSRQRIGLLDPSVRSGCFPSTASRVITEDGNHEEREKRRAKKKGREKDKGRDEDKERGQRKRPRFRASSGDT